MAESHITEVPFACIDQLQLMLDLHLPMDAAQRPADQPYPLIIWVHGGAWRMGTRKDVPIDGLTAHGFAIASVDYRLSTVARFPAQVHDIKAAIRYLRKHAAENRLDPNQFAIAGVSAGGHLAALTGVFRNEALPEDDSAGDDTSSAVSAIVSFFGASNLTSILSQSTPHGLSVRVPALELLLGSQPDAVPQLTRLASPVTHVTRQSPPMLLIHGDQDPQMPFAQSVELQKACQNAQVPVQLTVIRNGKHGGPEFFSDEQLNEVATFLRQHLQIDQDQP